jgi:predicted RNA methylase
MSRLDHHRPHYPDLLGHFKKSYHMEMISDPVRTDSICEALRRSLHPDDVFCELGCGTGIFSIYAAELCRKVYAIELDPSIAAVAALNISGSRFRDRIHLIEDDAMTTDLPDGEKANVIFAEMMSIWTVEEPQVVAINRARRDFLAPGGTVLPSRIVNLAELGWRNFTVRGVGLRAPFPLFTGVARPAVLTERRVVRTLDFTSAVPLDLGAAVEFTALVSGRLNCVVLHSYVEVGPGVPFSGTDSLMPATVVPLQGELEVQSGDRVQLLITARAWTDLGDVSLIARVI